LIYVQSNMYRPLPLVKNEIEKLATHGSLLPVPLLPAQLKSSKASSVRDWLAGGGEMGALMHAVDWQPARECFPEVWHIIGHSIKKALRWLADASEAGGLAKAAVPSSQTGDESEDRLAYQPPSRFTPHILLAAAEGDLRQDVQRFRECSTSR
jgi:hypothetical protein